MTHHPVTKADFDTAESKFREALGEVESFECEKGTDIRPSYCDLRRLEVTVNGVHRFWLKPEHGDAVVRVTNPNDTLTFEQARALVHGEPAPYVAVIISDIGEVGVIINSDDEKLESLRGVDGVELVPMWSKEMCEFFGYPDTLDVWWYMATAVHDGRPHSNVLYDSLPAAVAALREVDPDLAGDVWLEPMTLAK